MKYLPARRSVALLVTAAVFALIPSAALAAPTPSPSPSPVPYTGPTAVLAILSMYTEMPVIFDGISSNDGDVRGLRMDFDLDGDGVFELLDVPGVTDKTYTKPGTYTASLRVTDEFDLISIDTQTFYVDDVKNIGGPLFPGEGAPPLVGVSLSQPHVAPGGTVRLSVEAAQSQAFAVRLASASHGDPWLQASAQDFGTFNGKSTTYLTIKDSVKPGKYKVLVTSKAMQMSALDLVVDSPAVARAAALRNAAWGGGGLIVLGGLGLLWFWIARRRLRADRAKDQP